MTDAGDGAGTGVGGDPGPLAPVGDGRDPATGRFAPGWRGGTGNPHGAAVARFRAVLLGTVTDDDLRAVVARLVDCAKAGEPWAVRELLDRTIGRAGRAEESEADAAATVRRIVIEDERVVFHVPPPRALGQ